MPARLLRCISATRPALISCGSPLRQRLQQPSSSTFAVGPLLQPARAHQHRSERQVAAMAKAEQQSETKMFGGFNRTFKHKSKECECEMTFAIYYPPQAEKKKVPVATFLSGLTCTHENFIQKSGGQRVAAELGIAIVVPDTSPRGLGIEGEDDSYDFGTGAGFYLDATQEKWKQYRMYSYITKELQAVLDEDPKLDTSTMSIFGHSMGGHGALTIGLKNASKYKAISAFSAICHPSESDWGIKAFSGYLGDDTSQWAQYDATLLLKDYSGPKLPTLIDVGTADGPYQQGQLKPEDLQKANGDGKLDLTVRMQEGYDHSYFFIATFVEDHLRMHAQAMGI